MEVYNGHTSGITIGGIFVPPRATRTVLTTAFNAFMATPVGEAWRDLGLVPAEDAPSDSDPSVGNERLVLLQTIIEEHGDALERTGSGVPTVDSLNAARPEGTPEFSAAERDQLWLMRPDD